MLQAPVNVGQIISGILTLKPGGHFITKQYTTFEPITVSVMYALSALFDEFYLCKPQTSRQANSETYLIGKGFRSRVSMDHPYIAAMLKRITGEVSINIPLFDAKYYSKKYIRNIVQIAEKLSNKQIDKIKRDVLVCKTLNDRELKQVKNQFEPDIIMWYKSVNIEPLPVNGNLNMKDAHNQK